MIVAQEKRKKNIAEYILYLWQVEDLIRAMQMDMTAIENTLISQYTVDDQTKNEIRTWYSNLVLMMEKEQKQKSGHLQFLINLVSDLNRFHIALNSQEIEPQYTQLYNEIISDIQLVRQKSKNQHNDVEIALNTLYLLIMLKMKEEQISEGTQEAVMKFGNFLGYLSKLYQTYESGELEIKF